MVFATLREHRLTALAWMVGGAVANYVMILSLESELKDFPGGPQMLVRVLGPSIEAFRPLRWPAERLDTLGGYATYHNMLWITMFLGVYAAMQGARVVRGLESREAMSVWLSTGISRTQLLVIRSLSFMLVLAAIATGIAAGTALALQVVGAPDLSGSFVTLLASWCVATVCFAFGALVSQFFTSARTAAGIAATSVIVLSVLGNSAELLGPFEFVQYLSPFTYSNLSRALVPGIEPHWLSMVGVLLVACLILTATSVIFGRRDVGASALRRKPAQTHKHERRASRTVNSLFGDWLRHGWVSLLSWSVSSAALVSMMVSFEPVAMDAWSYFDAILPPTPDSNAAREAQYLAFSSTLMVPLIAGYVVAQSAKWSADFTAGRTGLIMSTPVSWMRVFGTRVVVTMLGVLVIVAASLAGLLAVAGTIGIGVDTDGLFRLTTMALLLGLAMIALGALTTVAFKHRSAVLVLSIYLGAAYLLGYIVPMLGWPEWVGRLSMFTAFGSPYLEWPQLIDVMVILTLAGPGLVLAYLASARSRKVP